MGRALQGKDIDVESLESEGKRGLERWLEVRRRGWQELLISRSFLVFHDLDTFEEYNGFHSDVWT